jgi:hypothetical protein
MAVAKKPVPASPLFTARVKGQPLKLALPSQVLKTLVSNSDWGKGLPGGSRPPKKPRAKGRPKKGV